MKTARIWLAWITDSSFKDHSSEWIGTVRSATQNIYIFFIAFQIHQSNINNKLSFSCHIFAAVSRRSTRYQIQVLRRRSKQNLPSQKQPLFVLLLTIQHQTQIWFKLLGPLFWEGGNFRACWRMKGNLIKGIYVETCCRGNSYLSSKPVAS
jgi:hypothetical protein